jgi:hypothetical protein
MDSHERWTQFPNSLRAKDPTTYPLFNLAMERAEFYATSLRKIGVHWIGLRFHFPLIWCPTRAYRVITEWDEFIEIE